MNLEWQCSNLGCGKINVEKRDYLRAEEDCGFCGESTIIFKGKKYVQVEGIKRADISAGLLGSV